MNLKETQQKDQIISSLFTNILVERERNDGIIKLSGVNINDPSNLLYIEVAKIVSDIYDIPIYIELGLVNYIKFIKNNWKRRKKICRLKASKTKNVEPIDNILLYVAKSFNVKYEFLGQIYNEYYKVKK